jgi:hypothetical protein
MKEALQGAAVRFNDPRRMALDMDGHLIVADCCNHCVCKVTAAEGRVGSTGVGTNFVAVPEAP